MQGVWDTLKEKKRRRKKETKAIQSCGELKQENHFFFQPFVWVLERARHRERESFSLRGVIWRDREKHSKSVREWKRKKETFFFTQVTHKEDKLVEFLWNFLVLQPWRVAKEDFATGFVVKLYILIEIYLLYIQFVVDSNLAQTWEL